MHFKSNLNKRELAKWLLHDSYINFILILTSNNFKRPGFTGNQMNRMIKLIRNIIGELETLKTHLITLVALKTNSSGGSINWGCLVGDERPRDLFWPFIAEWFLVGGPDNLRFKPCAKAGLAGACCCLAADLTRGWPTGSVPGAWGGDFKPAELYDVTVCSA